MIFTENSCGACNAPADATVAGDGRRESANRILPILPILIAFLLGLGSAAAAHDAPAAARGHHVQHYIELYGLADPRQEPAVARAHAIFEQVRRSADHKRKYLPQLRIVASPRDPWAIALPDGHVVLSRGAVELAYRDATPAEGDARIAFILGHELAHLAKDDYWHMQAYQALAGDPEGAELRRLLEHTADVGGADHQRRLAELQRKEWEADDLGFLYAAMAGYAVETLLGAPEAGQPDFFAYWMEQTHTRAAYSHPAPADRAHALRVRLRSVQNALDFFHYGVRLAHFGRHQDAVYFYRAFQQRFPSREVLGNLGLSYLQLAREAMEPERAFRFCLPALLDVETRASRPTTRGAPEDPAADGLPPAAREFLEQAVVALKQAVDMDGAYLPARINLAIVYLYLDEIHHARALIEEARRLEPQREDVALIRAVVLYHDGLSTDLWPYALKELETLTTHPGAGACGGFNLARILEERDRSGKALAAWNALAERAAELSPAHRRILCQRTPDHDACQTSPARAGCQEAAQFPWRLPAAIGTDLLVAETAQRYFAGWEALPFDWEHPGMNGHIYRAPSGTTVLDLDRYVEMVALRGPPLETAVELRARCGAPVIIQDVAGGEIWSYGSRWAAWVQAGQLREVWVARP